MIKNEPSAWLLSDFVDNDFVSLTLPDNAKNPRPLYTYEEVLNKRIKMTASEFKEFSKLAEYGNLYGVLSHLYDNSGKEYPLLYKHFSGDEDTIILANLWYSFDPKEPEHLIEVVPDPYRLHEGDLVISRGEHAADIHIVDGDPDIDSEGKMSAILIVNGIEDELYADPNEDSPYGGDYGDMEEFFRRYRLLSRSEDLIKENVNE